MKKAFLFFKQNKSNLTRFNKNIINFFVSTFIIGSFLVGIFFITRGVDPSTSELAFIEHSIIGKEAGSVLPASCDSNPPNINHESCFIDGQYVSQWAQKTAGGPTIPTDPQGRANYIVYPGDTVYLYFRVRNTGNVNWLDANDFGPSPSSLGRAVRFGTLNDITDPFTGSTRVSINSATLQTVPPNGETIFIIQGTVPGGRAGSVISSNWRLVDENRQWFGGNYSMTFYVDCPQGTTSVAGYCVDACNVLPVVPGYYPEVEATVLNVFTDRRTALKNAVRGKGTYVGLDQTGGEKIKEGTSKLWTVRNSAWPNCVTIEKKEIEIQIQ